VLLLLLFLLLCAACTAAGHLCREFRLLSLVVSQDRFLFIALAALLNLAEEPAVQRKMVKKGVAGLLLGLLGRPHLEVLLLVVSFLRRLCVFAVRTRGANMVCLQSSKQLPSIW
jgi:hypothetical protein